jgi:hypothetical protein
VKTIATAHDLPGRHLVLPSPQNIFSWRLKTEIGCVVRVVVVDPGKKREEESSQPRLNGFISGLYSTPQALSRALVKKGHK